MKITSQETTTLISGNTDAPRAFAIKQSNLAFKILSSGLYNDKIRAIIRELACNAWDAHVMAGKKDVPFDIQLPTDLHPTFRITDYGTGLSHERMMGIYTTYFDSDKSDSNEVIGAMGLGSKSPFCYTGSDDESQGFSVVSRFQGMKRIYSAYVAGGAPTIVLLSEKPTDEPNGLEIEFAVNSEDVQEFINKAKLALEFFTNPAPNVNIPGFEANQQQYSMKTELWGLRKEGVGLRAIQGKVQYEVGSIDGSRMDHKQMSVATLPLDLFFPIGQLEVAASREMLSNTQTTINNILTMLSKVYDDMAIETRRQLNECKSAWEARLRIQDIMKSNLGTVLKEVHGKGLLWGKYDNFTLVNKPFGLLELEYKTMQVTQFTNSNKVRASKTKLFKKLTPNERQLCFDKITTDVKAKRDFFLEMELRTDVAFVLNDIGIRGTDKYIDAFVQRPTLWKGETFGQTAFRTAYVFSVMDGKNQLKKMKKEFKAALNLLGNPPFILASQIKAIYKSTVDAPKQPHLRRPRVTGILKVTGNGESSRWRYNATGWRKYLWSRVAETELPSGTKLYVPVENMAVTDKTFRFHEASRFATLIDDVRKSKLFPLLTDSTPVFGLTEKAIAIKDGDASWVNVLDYITDNAQAFITDEKVMRLSIHLKPFLCPQETLLQDMRHEPEFANNPLVEFANDYFTASDGRREKQASHVTSLIETLTNLGKYKRGDVVDFESRWGQIIRNYYPLIAFCSSTYRNHGISYDKSMLEYVRLMDACR